jgi:hypothetical protein
MTVRKRWRLLKENDPLFDKVMLRLARGYFMLSDYKGLPFHILGPHSDILTILEMPSIVFQN